MTANCPEAPSSDSYALTVIDTAGIRDTDNPVEKGVRRAGACAAEAELLLWLVDASREKSWDHDGAPIWLVRNKIDLNATRSDTVIPNQLVAVTDQGRDRAGFPDRRNPNISCAVSTVRPGALAL